MHLQISKEARGIGFPLELDLTGGCDLLPGVLGTKRVLFKNSMGSLTDKPLILDLEIHFDNVVQAGLRLKILLLVFLMY